MAKLSKKYLKEFEYVLKSTWYDFGTLVFSDWEELAFWLGLPYDDRVKQAVKKLDDERRADLNISPQGWMLDYIDF